MLYPPAFARDPRQSTAAAAGGCMLIRRSALERIGGIERIRGELIDDCALAQAVKSTGGRIWLGLSQEAASIRRYLTFGEIGAMISRTAFTQLGYSWMLLGGTVAGLVLTYLVPPVLTLALPRGPAAGLAALAWFLMTAAYLPAVRYSARHWFWAPLLPLVALFYLGATLHSAWAHLRGHGGMWKGRSQAPR